MGKLRFYMSSAKVSDEKWEKMFPKSAPAKEQENKKSYDSITSEEVERVKERAAGDFSHGNKNVK